MLRNSQNKTILLLGTGGRLGQLLRAAWAQMPGSGAQMVFQSTRPLPERNSLVWSPGMSTDMLPGCDVVAALWGQTSGDAETLATNVTLAHHSRRIAQACGAQLCLHFSSIAVYGPVSNAAEETTPLNPRNPYGEAKRRLEEQVSVFADDGIRHCCLRLANVVGADSLAGPLRATGPITLDRFADGAGPRRSYIGASDLLQFILVMATLPSTEVPDVLNVASPSPVAMQDLARAAGKDFVWRAAPTRAVQEVTLDTTRLARLLPNLTLMHTADEMIADWMRLDQRPKAV